MTNKQKYNAFKREHGLTNNDVAEMFSYADGGSLARSSRYDRLINGIVAVVEIVHDNGSFDLPHLPLKFKKEIAQLGRIQRDLGEGSISPECASKSLNHLMVEVMGKFL